MNIPKSAKRMAAVLICVMLAAAFMLPISAHAQEPSKTVKVGWFESPFNITDRFDRRSGYAYEYQEKIAAYTGWEYEYVEGSWPELMQMLMDGEIDIMSDISYTEERASLILYSSLQMGTEEYYIYISADNSDYTPGNDSWFSGKKIGVNKGSIRFGIFMYARQAKNIEDRFERAKIAADRVKNDPERHCGFYDQA